MTTELVLAELLCCDCDCVFCNFLVFYVSAFYFILWAVVSAGYPALLSSSYFERINDDDDDLISRYCSTHVSLIPFPTLLSFSPRRSGKHRKRHTTQQNWQPVTKVGGDQIHLVPMICGVGGDTSDGSHRVVAPMSLVCHAVSQSVNF